MKETIVDENTGYFLVRNIVAHEPMHDFNPSGCIIRIKKLNKRLIQHTSGGNNSQKGGDYQSWDSGHNLSDIDDNFVNSDFKYFNDETCFDESGMQFSANFNVSKILTYESEAGLIKNEINTYIKQVIIFNETPVTRTISSAEEATIRDEKQERMEQLAELTPADGLAAEEKAEAEGEINIALYGVQDYETIIRQIRTQFKQGDVADRTRSKTIELDNNLNTIIHDCQYIVDISDYFRVLFVSFFTNRQLRSGGGEKQKLPVDDADAIIYNRFSKKPKYDKVLSEKQADDDDDDDADADADANIYNRFSKKLKYHEVELEKPQSSVDIDKDNSPLTKKPTIYEKNFKNTTSIKLEDSFDDLPESPFINQYIEMIEILNFLKHEDGWLNLQDIDNDQLSDDEIDIIKKDIIKIIEFYLELFEYYIGEINNKNSVFEINNSNFIRNGLFLFFLNKLTNEHSLPNDKDFYNDIFEIGRTNISDEESDLLYKLRNFPSNENGQSGGAKTLYSEISMVFKDYENNATLMTNIHIKSLANKLAENEINFQVNKEQYILEQLQILGADDAIDDEFTVLLKSAGPNSYFHNPDEGALALADDVINPRNFYNNKVIKAICYMIILVGMGGRANEVYLRYINDAEALFINILQKTIEMSVNNITQIFNANVEDAVLIAEWNKFIPMALTDIFTVIINLNISSRSIFGRSNMNDETKSSYKCKVLNELNNKIFYKFHKNFMSMNRDKKLVGRLKAVKRSKSTQGTAETKLFTNNLLVSVCNHIDNLFSKDNIPIANKVYNYQKNLLKNVSEKKKIPSDVDTKLLQAFKDEYQNSNNFKYIDDATFNDDIKDKLRVESQKVHIINNAITSKIGLDGRVQITEGNKNDLNTRGFRKEIIRHMEDDNVNFKIFCPITSKLDAMGSFGSCNNATPDEQPSSGNIMNVSIITPLDEKLKFEYGFKLSKSKRDVFILEYYIRAVGDNDEKNIFFISGLVEQNIKHTGSNIKLSAQNTFERVLDKIESNYLYLFEGLNTPSKKINYDTILAESDTNDIIGSLSNKSAGDIGQELSAIIKDGGYNTTAAETQFRTLGQGDRPSFVRASIIAIKSRNTANNDINKDTSIFYSTESKSGSAFKTSVYITKHKTPTGGAKNKIKKRKVKKNKNRKNKTKKLKKHKKIKPKKSKKYINKLSKNKKTTIKKRKKQNKVKRKSIKK
jgi:hypothetical protein